MEQIKILTLLENQESRNKGLVSAHGLSFYIQKGDVKLMFDFGPGREAWENGRRMNVPFGEIRYGIFSHSHYDHSCGFLWAEEYGLDAAAVCGAAGEFFRPKYSLAEEGYGKEEGREEGKEEGEKEIIKPEEGKECFPEEIFGKTYTYMGCGFSEEYLESHTRQILICKDVLELGSGCWAAGNFGRGCLWEHIPGKYVREGAHGMEPDTFADEICLVLALPGGRGLGLIAGCSHPGIVNMVHTVKERWNMPVQVVIGGLHCAKLSKERMEKTAEALKEAGVRLAVLNHCSGTRIQEVMAGWGIRSFSLKTGDYLCL